MQAGKEQDIELGFEDFVRACGSEPEWIVALIEENVISVEGAPKTAHYSGWQLARVRRAHRLHRDFDASAPAVALLLDLLDEVAQLRRRLR